MKIYDEQLKLLIRCLPTVASIETFTLKGGTAINLFVQPDFPRLSVDIDLIYLPLQNRADSLLGIEAGLLQIQKKLMNTLSGISIAPHKNNQTKTITRLTVEGEGVAIKIEPNLVLRGTVYPPLKMDLSKAVVARYGLSAYNVPVASKADLYGGKICAALDRQHPRDLFDVKRLLEEGISEDIKKAFLVYLASHNRPMHELLDPNRLELQDLYNQEFLGMSMTEVTCEMLIQTRENLIQTLHQLLTQQDKEFLLGIKNGVIKGELLALAHIDQLPGIQWKLVNISRMDPLKHRLALEKLEKVLA